VIKFLDIIKSHLKAVRYRWLVLLHDLTMIPLAWMSAYWLRYNLSKIPDEFLDHATNLIPIVMVIQGATLLFFGVHRGIWRFTSMPDLIRLIKAIVFGTIFVAIAIFLYTRLAYVPRSIFILYGMILAFYLCAARIGYRFLKERRISTKSGKKVVIIGAGAAGEQVARDLKRDATQLYEPIAYIDDDPSKIGKEIHGIRVAADCESIPVLTERWNIDLILIAIPSATDKQMQRIVGLCKRSGTEFRTLPGIHDVVTGHVGIKDLRAVQIEDLLGRDPVLLDRRRIAEALREKKVLVTGGGGSIGSELSRQLVSFEIDELILLEQSEYNLYMIEHELRRTSPGLKFHVVLGDICDETAVNRVFARFKPDLVFHAAAYKHVPMLEGQLREAIKNNIIGSKIVAEQARNHQCETFVLISTDKAVNPKSYMGACKRVAEILCQSLDTVSDTKFVTVRFGNVLGSTGSVVPFFRRQIEGGGPVTVTHPEVTRYFMTPSEATQLILEAGIVGEGGEIYVLDMGDPIQISFLAEQMIKLYGKKPGEEIDIEYTGLRDGEKINEELFYSNEKLQETKHDKILLASGKEMEWKVIEPIIIRFDTAVKNYDENVLEDLLNHLVPLPEKFSEKEVISAQ